MVSSDVTVISKSLNDEQAYKWHSTGVEGYTIEPTEKDEIGTKIILKIKDDTEDEKYSRYLEEFVIKNLVKKYSDYIRYPILMDVEHEKLKEETKNEYEKVKETETLNSMIPLWKKKKSEIKQEEYDSFYTSKFSDLVSHKKLYTLRQKVHLAIMHYYLYHLIYLMIFILNNMRRDYNYTLMVY